MDSIVYEDIRSSDYKGYRLTMKDPYGFITVSGIPGQFTSFTQAQKAVDAFELAKSSPRPANKKSASKLID